MNRGDAIAAAEAELVAVRKNVVMMGTELAARVKTGTVLHSDVLALVDRQLKLADGLLRLAEARRLE